MPTQGAGWRTGATEDPLKPTIRIEQVSEIHDRLLTNDVHCRLVIDRDAPA